MTQGLRSSWTMHGFLPIDGPRAANAAAIGESLVLQLTANANAVVRVRYSDFAGTGGSVGLGSLLPSG